MAFPEEEHEPLSSGQMGLDSNSGHPASASSSSSEEKYVMENDYEYVHGRVDPAIDENLKLVTEVPVEQFRRDHGQPDNSLPSSSKGKGIPGASATQSETSRAVHDSQTPKANFFTTLPPELIDHILFFLNPLELVAVFPTCRLLSKHARSDLSWQHHVQENVPGVRLTSPAPCKTFQELYVAHDPHWFLSKYKVWFSDFFLTGKIIIVRYDPRRGCIEGYRLVAERPPPTFDSWELDDEVVIHSFDPVCRLHMDEPVLQLDPSFPGQMKQENRFGAEIRMPITEPNRYGVYSNFLLTRPVESRPNMQLWPPPTIPARQRVRNASQRGFIGSGHKPQKREEVSDQAFRIRRWIEMNAPGVYMGEEVNTFSTLDPRLYTPTEEKPYRGIWVGDYSGHGCEFLLLNQPDDDEPFDEASVIQAEDETTKEWEARKEEERIYRGRIEAIKLTGDPNIPRGEYSFVADDISSKGFIRTATDARFRGARIVRSRGHIAARMFIDDKYIESQLIMISPNRLAQYWVGFGHISYFERVDIDGFLAPPSSSTSSSPSHDVTNRK